MESKCRDDATAFKQNLKLNCRERKMSSQNIPKYLQQEAALSEESKELISTLPRQNGWFSLSHLYLYQGFWYQPDHLQAVISCQKHFRVEDSDVFLVTYPKCGTTWLKAIIFTLLNRKQYPVAAITINHPLLTSNPHDLVPSLEINLYADNQIPDPAAFPSRRLFSTHMPYVSLPKKCNSKCKVVYVCRNPRDTFVSLWHFMNKLRAEEDEANEIEEMFEAFCDGAVGYGPFWDHVLEYWKQSKEKSETVFFLKYEDMKEKGAVELRRLAQFLECPLEEEEVEGILKLTSFESMSSLEVNKVGRLMNGMENRHFFRQGVVGDWTNYMSAQMVNKLDRITRDKFSGSGLLM